MSKVRELISLFLPDVVCIAGRPASMSSVYTVESINYDLKAAFANDGIYFPPGNSVIDEIVSLAHTLNENNPWWMVDLEHVYCIWAVRILNRGTFCNYLSFHHQH